MSRAIKDSAATRSLRTRVELRSTGRLTVGAGAVEVAVHLLNGDIVAATAPDDERQIVRILHLLGVLDDTRAEDLESRLEGGGDVLGDLLSMDLGPVVDRVLHERFVQNLCDFVSSISTPKFTEQKGLFVSNIQMGHDTPALIDEVCRLSDLAKAIDLDALVVRGRMPPGEDAARESVAECLNADPRTVSSLLHEVPVEPTRARVVLSELLLDGVALPYTGENGVDELPLEDDETVSADWPPKYLKPSPPPSEPVAAPAPTVEAHASAPSAVIAAPPPDALEPEPVELGLDDFEPLELEPDGFEPLDEDEEEESGDEPAAPEAQEEPAPSPAHAEDQDEDAFAVDAGGTDDDGFGPQTTLTPDTWDDDPYATPATVSRTRPEGVAPKVPADGGGAPRSLNEWMSKASSAVGDDDLEFFDDHEHDRGQGGGRFQTESKNLDKVEVAEMADDGPIEVDEAPSARFGAPTISEEEACAKIDVANEVLGVILEAFDAAEGPGRGRAVLQLLVDGVPSPYAPLLHDLRIGDDGALPYRPLLRNLGARPTTEHRLLLNNGLADIIERALSSAADELPDEQIDSVLESVAGYRARLGL